MEKECIVCKRKESELAPDKLYQVIEDGETHICENCLKKIGNFIRDMEIARL